MTIPCRFDVIVETDPSRSPGLDGSRTCCLDRSTALMPSDRGRAYQSVRDGCIGSGLGMSVDSTHYLHDAHARHEPGTAYWNVHDPLITHLKTLPTRTVSWVSVERNESVSYAPYARAEPGEGGVAILTSAKPLAVPGR